MRCAFVILAGGSGERFGAYKPTVRMAGRPLLYWTLKNLKEQSRLIRHVALAAPAPWTWARFQKIGAVPSGFSWKPLMVKGGATRFESLTNAIAAMGGVLASGGEKLDALFVHDAARPLWPGEWIGQMLGVLRREPRVSGVIPMIPVRETVKSVNGSVGTLKNRQFLRFSQTPQLVRWDDFGAACRRLAPGREVLDEAQVLELARRRVFPFTGSPDNIKMTYPRDLRLLEALRGS